MSHLPILSGVVLAASVEHQLSNVCEVETGNTRRGSSSTRFTWHSSDELSKGCGLTPTRQTGCVPQSYLPLVGIEYRYGNIPRVKV